LEEGRKLFGTFGVDLGPSVYSTSRPAAKSAVIHNLLYYIAPTFVIDQTQLQLGPNPAAVLNFQMIPMVAASPLPTAMPNGARPWLSHVPLCFTIGKYVKKPVCQPTLFDTGASDVNFKGGVTAPVPTSAACSPYAVKGLLVTMSRPHDESQPLATFKSGYVQNYNALRFTTPRPGKTPTTNTGLTFYNRDEIFFDAVKGRIGLLLLRKPGTIGIATCTS